jgi:hypothetical protein
MKLTDMELEICFNTTDALAAAMQQMVESGWSQNPAQIVEKGIVGFTMLKDGEPPTFIYCPIFGNILEPKIQECGTLDEFVDILASRLEENMEKWSNPETLKTGFCSYAKANEGVSEVFSIHIRELKDADRVKEKLLPLIKLFEK